jgi:hypothetical protein
VFSLYAAGQLGIRVCMTRHSSVFSEVTPPSQLLVWATSSQAGSQAPVCSLELSREESTAKDPKQGGEAEGRKKWPCTLPSQASTGRASRRLRLPEEGQR